MVCTGTTGHTEAVLITYNPEGNTFEKLLDAFFQRHDPTSVNRQVGQKLVKLVSVDFPRLYIIYKAIVGHWSYLWVLNLFFVEGCRNVRSTIVSIFQGQMEIEKTLHADPCLVIIHELISFSVSV